MYLKKTATGPLVDNDMHSVMKFIADLKGKNELPGWLGDEKNQIYFNYYPYSASDVLDVFKSGDGTTYHYTVVRNPVDGTWKLQRAWQTNANGQIVKEFELK